MFILFFICLILILLTLPIWPYSRAWGYQFSAICAIAAIILLFIILRSVSYLEIESDEEGTSIKIERMSSQNQI